MRKLIFALLFLPLLVQSQSVLMYNGKPLSNGTTVMAAYPWYGIEFDINATSPTVTRIASSPNDMALHATLPIQSQMRRLLMLDNGTINYWLSDTNSNYKADGSTPSDLTGADGMVLVYTPAYYRRFELSGNTFRCKLSMFPLAGFELVSACYVGAYEASLQRSNLHLASVKNTTTDFRGGGNQSTWDTLAKTQLGKPATDINRTNFRTYARNRGAQWNLNTYEQHKSLTWLFVVEYATRYSQLAINATLTAQGYRQGGLGAGVTTAVDVEWNTWNTRYPFINCGAANSLGNRSGAINVSIANFGGAGVTRTFAVNQYRGIEMPFGHTWKILDGANMEVKKLADGDYSALWIANNPANFSDVSYVGYTNKGNTARVSGFVKIMLDGEIVPTVAAGAADNTYWTDYYYTDVTSSSIRMLFVGGAANDGSGAGFVFVYSPFAPSSARAFIGSRLSFIP
jgi:hypothetical protein